MFEFKKILVILFLFIFSCGGKKSSLNPKTPWEDSLAQYFDDSVDYTLNPQSLSGEWLNKYQEQLGVRIARSEYILGIKVTSVTKKVGEEGRECKDIFGQVKARVKGEWSGDSVTLHVCDDSAGFDSFKEDDSRLFDRVFIAFLKLYNNKEGAVGIHWHLSPLSKGLKEGMDNLMKTPGEEEKKTSESKSVVEQK